MRTSRTSQPASGKKLLNLMHINKFEISAPQYPSNYSTAGNGDELDIVGSRMSD
jgi:hypothetical protein